MLSLVKGGFILVKGVLRFSLVQGKFSLVKGKHSSLSRKTVHPDKGGHRSASWLWWDFLVTNV
jgi:hypothetical protein